MPEIALQQSQVSKSQVTRPAEHVIEKAGPVNALDPITSYQQAFGNQAVQRMLRAKVIQAKLVVNPPDDEYEKEADQVADTVMRMPEPVVQRACPSCKEDKAVQTAPLAAQITPLVQRQAVPEEEEEEAVQAKAADGGILQHQEKEQEEEEPLQTAPLAAQTLPLLQMQAASEEEEEEPVQAKAADGGTVQRQEEEPEEEKMLQTKSLSGRDSYIQREVEDAGFQARIETPRDGKPLALDTQREMEAVLATDLSHVRVHDNALDRADADRLNAKAFTHCSDIWIGSVGNVGDRKLMAHELTHVVQQNTAGPSIKPMIYCDANPAQSNLQMLDALLNRRVAPNEILDLLAKLTLDEKASVRNGGYQARIANLLNVNQMVEAVKILDLKLNTALLWVESTSNFRLLISYAAIKTIITNASQPDRDALRNDARWIRFFVDICDNVTMVEAVNDLQFDPATKLDWTLEKGCNNKQFIVSTANSIAEYQTNAALIQLNAFGHLEPLLKELDSDRGQTESILYKFYYWTNEPTAKAKVGKYYKIPEEQTLGMNLIHDPHAPGKEIEYPENDIIDPADRKRKIYDGRRDKDYYKGYLNKDFWISLFPNYHWTFRLRAGKNASDGINKIFEGPTRLECLSMTNALNFRTILKTYGDDKFNNMFDWRNLIVGYSSNVLDSYLTNLMHITSATKEREIQKGDWVYFQNHPKYPNKHPAGAWQGENVFCMGKNPGGENEYRGFGMPTKMTDRQLVDILINTYDRARVVNLQKVVIYRSY
jgi:hypothetical protein